MINVINSFPFEDARYLLHYDITAEKVKYASSANNNTIEKEEKLLLFSISFFFFFIIYDDVVALLFPGSYTEINANPLKYVQGTLRGPRSLQAPCTIQPGVIFGDST